MICIAPRRYHISITPHTHLITPRITPLRCSVVIVPKLYHMAARNIHDETQQIAGLLFISHQPYCM